MVSVDDMLRYVDVRSDVTDWLNSSLLRHGAKLSCVGPLAVTFDRKLPDAGSRYLVGLKYSDFNILM